MHRLKSSAGMHSGWVTVMGQQFTVTNGVVEVDTLHQANMLIENGYKILGVEGLRRARNILVKRGRGLGDLLMVTPVLRLIRKANPEARITLALDGIFLDLLKGVPWVDRIVTQPQCGFKGDDSWIMLPDSREHFDYCLNMDGFVEMSDEVAVKHRVDLFAELAGFDAPLDPEDRRMWYSLQPGEAEWAERLLREEHGIPRDRKILAMAVRSTCFNRNLPANDDRRIADLAVADGWAVVVLDHDGAFGWEAPGVVNLAGRTSIRQLAAVIKKSDMFFGPDSGAWHLASAMDVPNVAYFGAINFKLRVTSPATKVVFRNATCYPCDGYDCAAREQLACLKMSADDMWKVVRKYDETLAAGAAAPSSDGPVQRATLTDVDFNPASWAPHRRLQDSVPNQSDREGDGARTLVADGNHRGLVGAREGGS